MTYALITVVLWATMAPAVKLMQGSLPTMEVIFIAGVFSVVFLFGRTLLIGKGYTWKTFGAKNYGKTVALAVPGFLIYEFLYYYGID